MDDQEKTRSQLIEELRTLRERVGQQEAALVRERNGEGRQQCLRDQALLSQAAIELVDFPLDEDVYQFIAERLQDLSDARLVAVTAFDSQLEEAHVRAVVGWHRYSEAILNLLGRNPVGMTLPLGGEARERLFTNELERVSTGLYGLVFEQIPRPVCRALEKALRVGDMYGMGFLRDGNLFGSAVLVLRQGGVLRNPQAVQALMSIAAVALQHRQTQEELQQSKEQYQALYDNAPLPYQSLDGEGRILDVNPAWLKTLGYEREEVLGTWFGDLLHPDWQPRFEKRFPAFKQRGRLHNAHYRIRHAKGHCLDVSFEGRVGRRPDGSVRQTYCVFRDITERRRAERKLRESEKRLRLIVEGTEALLVNVSPKGRITYVNEAAATALGYRAEDVIGRLYLRFIHPDDRRWVADVYAEQAQLRAPSSSLEFRLLARDGKARWVKFVAHPLVQEGEVVELAALALDITDRKRMEEALHRSQSRYRTLFNSASDAMFIHGPKGSFLQVNDVACESLGYPRSELLAMGPSDITASDGRERETDLFKRLSEQNNVYHEAVHVRRDGTEIPVELNSCAFEYGEKEAILTIARDISERKEMEEQLRHQERLAAVGRLAGGIAHEFNNILASITLYADMSLTGHSLPTGAERGLRTILDESQRAADLVQQIVDFSRSAMLDRETFDLTRFVEEQASFLRRTLSESIKLSIDGSAATCPVRADKARLRQALVNLVTNARDAMPQGGELRFRIERLELERGEEPPLPDMEKPSWACLRVADTGTGMTKEVREHLFEPFFTTKEVGEGAGLGLSQVHGIVKQHEGCIDVETAVDEGTTVIIYLPLSEENGKEARPAAPSGVPGGAGETILVVEDAPAVRQAVQSTLESLDYRVLTAANGREALEALRLGPVDLVVTDVVMPEVGGEALLDALQERRSGVQAIAMTGHVMDVDIERLKDAGFADVISKPFSFEEIAVAVNQALDG